MKRLTLVFICIFIFLMAGCQSQDVLPNDDPTPPVHSSDADENTPGSDILTNWPANPGNDSAGIDTTGFQKEMNIQHPFRLSGVCKTEVGYYLHYDGLLYFLDGTTGNVTAVCAKPECSHTDDNCNAWINSRMLSYYQGKLYYVNSDAKSDSMKTLYSVNLDGTNHTEIQRLQLEYMPWRTVLCDPILAGGNLYFLEGDSKIYTVKLGQDVSRAVLLFEDDMSRKLESAWKFWADDGEVYAMNHILDNTGYEQDILYRLGAAESETREIWRSTELAKGVSDSSWYITNGHMYYCFSGSDLWDIELETGNAKKMIGLADTIKSGTVLFTDTYVLFLDDQPDSQWGAQSGLREGGENISVYDYSGNLVGEVSLSPIFEKHSDVVQCSMAFADDNCVYLLVYRGAFNSASTLFYQVAWDKGSVYEVTNWPGADVIYDDTVHETWQVGTFGG